MMMTFIRYGNGYAEVNSDLKKATHLGAVAFFTHGESDFDLSDLLNGDASANANANG
jgi:hypothetical protein